MLAREVKRQTVPIYLRWLPDSFFPLVNAAVSQAQADGATACPHLRHRSKSTWTFIMPFDLEHYIDNHAVRPRALHQDHSSTGEHLRR